jgi:hypothetical protein
MLISLRNCCSCTNDTIKTFSQTFFDEHNLHSEFRFRNFVIRYILNKTVEVNRYCNVTS